MPDVTTQVSSLEPALQTKSTEPARVPSGREGSSAPSSGRRAAFRDVRRQLTDTELSNPGVQKLLLDMLEQADSECDNLHSYLTLYHEADKRAAVLSEQLKNLTTIEVFFGAGVGLGGTILGLAPFLYGAKPEYGLITAVVGFLMIVIATVGRIVKR